MPARILRGFACLLFLFASCDDQNEDVVLNDQTPSLPAERYQYNLYSDPTDAKSTLGRVLFYDKMLSQTNDVSCASCHRQSAAFADNRRLTFGVGGHTLRNVMAIQNIPSISPAAPKSTATGYYGGALTKGPLPGNFFWDGRENSLEKLVFQPITNPVEMGVKDVDGLVRKIAAQPYYQSLFKDAYGDNSITKDNIANALAIFLTSIKSNHTRFDLHFVSPASEPFTPLETEGMELFLTKYNCNGCHAIESTQLDAKFANIGLVEEYYDKGLSNVTLNPADDGKFKIPSLRNVEFTAPYMHDGSYPRLDNVIEHYDHGIQHTRNLAPELTIPLSTYPRQMGISDHERDAIIAFLLTLSDKSVLTDPKFSDPFVTKQ